MQDISLNSDSPIREIFVGRTRELDILRQELSGSKSKMVSILGPGGMGKTSLALMFAEMNRELFPAGIYSFHANQIETLAHSVGRQINPNSAPYLIIIDDIEARPLEHIDNELTSLRQNYPKAKFITTSRFSISGNSIDLQLRLEGLARPEFQEIMNKRLARLKSTTDTDELYDALLGHPLASKLVSDLLRDDKYNIREILSLIKEFTWPGLIDSLGKEIPRETPEHEHIISDIISVSDEFLKKLHDKPELLYELTPRGFEELVAELLNRLEYEVTLTPASRDGGKDIYAAKKDPLGTFLYIVECKKYAPDNRVGVGLIRQLNGVVQAEQATAGILATTSFFSRDAKEFQKTIPFLISLKDYFGIQNWLKSIIEKRNTETNE